MVDLDSNKINHGGEVSLGNCHGPQDFCLDSKGTPRNISHISGLSNSGDIDTCSQGPQYTFFLNFVQTKIGEAFLVPVQRPGMAGNMVAPKINLAHFPSEIRGISEN